MAFDPEDVVFVIPLPERSASRRSRRCLTVADADWQGSREQDDGRASQLRTRITVNSVPAELVLEAVNGADDPRLIRDLILTVEGRDYRVSIANPRG